MVDTLAIEDQILSTGISERDLDIFLSGDEFSNYQLLNLLYPEFKRRVPDTEIDQLFDLLPVDIESVKGYIIWLTIESKHLSREKLNQALRQARTILAIASVMDGNYLQRKKPKRL
jgi:hypothetical protein